jgi:vWA-MoxR associated protein C-terminal domain/vWA-MoxR associated protein middle region (VMAP-M) 1
MGYEIGDIRKLICKAFTTGDFETVVFDYFPSVKAKFCGGQTQTERQMLLADRVIIHEELSLLLTAIEENNKFIYQEFKVLDDLIELLTFTDSKILIDRVYKSTFPEIRHRAIPEALSTLIMQIADLPSDVDRSKPKPLDRFVNCLMQDRCYVDIGLCAALYKWAVDQGITIHSLQHIYSNLETYLKIEVKQHPSGKYLVSAAIVEDPDPHNFTAETRATTIDIPISPDSKYAHGYSQAQLPEILNELLAICSSGHSIALSDLNIQWFLPIELMSLPIEHWQIQTGRKQQHCNGIRCKSAIVRSVDRNSQYYRSVLGEWKKNWKNMPTCPQSLCNAMLKNLDPMAGEREIDLSKPNVVGCKFIEHEDPQEQEDFWDELFSQGLPIALWCRQSGSDLAIMDDVTNCTLVNLPVSLTKHRKQVLSKIPEDPLPPEPAAHLSLLWDNPFRSFPTITYQSY